MANEVKAFHPRKRNLYSIALSMIKKGEKNMSRYRGPSWKISRRLGYSTLETGKEIARRPYGPGPHAKDRRKKVSEYGKQLMEKQKLRETYGVSERQFQRMFLMAKQKKDVVTGVYFMQLLESRLDNLVFRLGYARTRRQARQLVAHGHVLVNNKKVDIPSYIVPVGSEVTMKETSKNLAIVKASLETLSVTVPYVSVDKEKVTGKYIRLPERNEMARDIQESQIVEFYNRKL